MNRLGDLFSSKARVEILRVLNNTKNGAGLRETARLAGVYPRSAELTLAKLVAEGMVKCRRVGNRSLFKLNREHEDIPLLEDVFASATNALVRARSKSLHERGRSILPFISEASRMLKQARRE